MTRVVTMYPKETDRRESPDSTEQRPLLLDGTANLEYGDGEQVPRVKGLVELLNEFFAKNRNNDK